MAAATRFRSLSQRLLLGAAALLGVVSTAAASGGLWCVADDAQVRFKIESGITRGMGNPLFGFHGALEIRAPSVPEGLRATSFDEGNLRQHWLDAKELKMQLYRDRETPFAEVELLIETKAIEEATYAGRYALRVFETTGDAGGEGKTITLDGKASCFAE